MCFYRLGSVHGTLCVVFVTTGPFVDRVKPARCKWICIVACRKEQVALCIELKRTTHVTAGLIAINGNGKDALFG